MEAVPEELLIVFPDSARIIFQIILWPIVIFGVIGNVGVIIRICLNNTKKKSVLKPFYRFSLLSLAISDLLLLVTSGVNTLSTVSNNTILWSLPAWCCIAIPYLQTVAVIVTSLTLAGIAIDRYAAMRSKYPISNGLKWPCAITFVTGIWTISFAASSPILGIYNDESLVVINNSTYYMATLCLTQRSEATVIFTALFAVIFVPLGAVFLIVHALLALNIWKRNFPGDHSAQQTTNHESQLSNENSTVSTSLGKTKDVASKKNGPTPSHIARKKRTVRVILVLISVFALCRLPHWIFLLCKLHATISGDFAWYIQVILTSLSLVNAAFHPFLYAFLNEALSLVTWLRAWSTRTTVKSTIQPISEQVAGSTISAKIPRGPYHSP